MPKLIEVEIRLRLKNPSLTKNRLKKLGTEIIGSYQIIDYWFCPKAVKNHQQALIDNTGFALRIRDLKNLSNGKKTVQLECKTLVDGKDHCLCHEHEILLNDTKMMRHILNDIGLKEFLKVDKFRTVYRYKNIKLCFDKIKKLGNGLEIEILTKDNLAEAKKKIIDLAIKLGVEQKDILEKSLTYLAMEKLSRF